jgi:hypothetical protein
VVVRVGVGVSRASPRGELVADSCGVELEEDGLRFRSRSVLVAVDASKLCQGVGTSGVTR